MGNQILARAPELYTVYRKLKPHIEETENGITKKDFMKQYFNEFHKVIGADGTSSILKALASVGLIIEEVDPVDHRKMRYTVPDMGGYAEVNTSDKSICIPPPQDLFNFDKRKAANP